MASENKSKPGNKGTKNYKKRKQQYLPYNKGVKKKGSFPLRPGLQGFFITCDGGRERQASNEAINVIDSFYEELVDGKDSGVKFGQIPDKPLNKKTKFTYSDSSSSDDDDDDDDEEEEEEEERDANKDVDQKDKEDKDKPGTHAESDVNHESFTNANSDPHKQEENKVDDKEDATCHKEPPAKKQCLETEASKNENVNKNKVEEKSIDKLIEAELRELGDRSKRRFNNLDSSCNGVVFVQMHKRDGDPSPKDIVQHMMMSVAATRKHMSRFMLRVLPIEVTCYASEDEIKKAIQPLIAQYFPVENQTAHKFAVLYEARANTGIDRMKIINAVAKSVPSPHKVDLNNPDKNIVVQIVKTVCLIGVVEKYKELAKYNLRQLTSSQP